MRRPGRKAKAALSGADYRQLAAFRHELRRFLTFSEDAARRAGLAPQQHQALLAIKGAARKISVGELARQLSVRHHSAVGLVDRLVSHGYVERRAGVEDRRRVTLALTRKGETVLDKLSSAHRDELRRTAPLLRSLLAPFEK